MKKLYLGVIFAVCFTAYEAAHGVEAKTADAVAQTVDRGAPALDFPTEIERQQTRERLTRQRQQMQERYQQAMKLCYQQFDVTSCRTKARDQRIDANAALRKEELHFNAIERQIHAQEASQELAERTTQAQRKKAEIESAVAIAASQQRAATQAQKQLSHVQQGTKREAYEQKQRAAAQHRADVEKKLHERNKDPAAPLPVPSR